MGKGDTYRKVDRKKWEATWKRYCDVNGCSYKNGLCVYCGEPRDKNNIKTI